MPITAYRVCRAIHARLDGEGSKLAGGRWNSPGHAVVYLAESVALAVLENLVHMSRENFPSGYVVVKVAVPDSLLVLSLDHHWRLGGQQDIGDSWLASLWSPVLKVPSAVVPGAYNFLLNPEHPDFSRIRVEPPVPFRFDERLFVLKR